MPAIHTPGIVAEFPFRQQPVRFFVSDLADVIQNQHLNGLFYEAEELEIIERHFPKGGIYLDVGANVGNHLVYVGKFCAPGQMIAIEPNPAANGLLRLNLMLNGLSAETFAVGFSDHDGRAEARWPTHNLGGARMFEQEGGRVPLICGDDLLQGRRIGFIKIDVETAELAVLAGLQKTIEWSWPPIFIEVDNANAEGVLAWAAKHSYEVVDRYRRYGTSENLMLVSRAAITSL